MDYSHHADRSIYILNELMLTSVVLLYGPPQKNSKCIKDLTLFQKCGPVAGLPRARYIEDQVTPHVHRQHRSNGGSFLQMAYKYHLGNIINEFHEIFVVVYEFQIYIGIANIVGGMIRLWEIHQPNDNFTIF